MNGVDDISDISVDPLYRRRIPTGHESFDELYVKIFGGIPEEQNSRISQYESFESLHQKFYNDNAEDISRQLMFDDLYAKYADELQVFSGGDDSIDFVYTLIDNSSNVSYTTSKHELTSPQTKSNISFSSPSYQKTNSQTSKSQKGNNNTPKINSQQKIESSSLIPPPITNPPQREVSVSLTSSEIKSTNSFSPESLTKQVPEKMRTRSSTRLKTTSPKMTKIYNVNSTSARVLRNHRSKFSDDDTKSDIDDSPVLTSKSGNSKKELQTPIITMPEVVTDNNGKKNNSNGVKIFSLTTRFDDNDIDSEVPPKKKVKSKKNLASKK